MSIFTQMVIMRFHLFCSKVDELCCIIKGAVKIHSFSWLREHQNVIGEEQEHKPCQVCPSATETILLSLTL